MSNNELSTCADESCLPLLQFDPDSERAQESREIFFRLIQKLCRKGRQSKEDVDGLQELIRKHRATKKPNWKAFRKLLPALQSFDDALLQPACETGSVEFVDALLTESAFRGNSDSLISAVRRGDVLMASVLLDSGMYPDVCHCPAKSDETPLLVACDFNPEAGSVLDRITLVEILASRSDNLWATTSKGVDAFQRAARITNDTISFRVMNALVGAPAFQMDQGRMGRVLVLAIESENIQTAKLLADKGVFLPENQVARLLRDVLHKAKGVKTVIQCSPFLVNNCIDFRDVASSFERPPQCRTTALHVACANKLRTSMRHLLENHADPLAADDCGKTVLETVFELKMQERAHGSFGEVLTTLFQSAGLEAANHFILEIRIPMLSPLQQACQNDSLAPVVDLLLEWTSITPGLDLVRHVQGQDIERQIFFFGRYLRRWMGARDPTKSVLELLEQDWFAAAVMQLARLSDSVGLVLAMRVLMTNDDSPNLLSEYITHRGRQYIEQDVNTVHAALQFVDNHPTLPNSVFLDVAKCAAQEGGEQGQEHLRSALIQRCTRLHSLLRINQAGDCRFFFTEDAEEESSELRLQLACAEAINGGTFRAWYGNGSNPGVLKGNFRLVGKDDVRYLQLKGTWEKQADGDSGDMVMKIPLQSLCPCSNCLARNEGRGKGYYFYGATKYEWNWTRSYRNNNPPGNQSCLIRELEFWRWLPQDLAPILRLDLPSYKTALERLCSLRMWKAVRNLLESDPAPFIQGESVSTLVYRDISTWWKLTRPHKGLHVTLGLVLDLPSIAEQAQEAVLGLLAGGNVPVTTLFAAIVEYRKTRNDHQSRDAFQKIVETICERRIAVGRAGSWDAAELSALCSLAAADNSPVLQWEQFLQQIVSEHGALPFLRQTRGECALLAALRGRLWDLVITILEAAIRDPPDPQGEGAGEVDLITHPDVLVILTAGDGNLCSCSSRPPIENVRVCVRCRWRMDAQDSVCARCNAVESQTEACPLCHGTRVRRRIRTQVIDLLLRFAWLSRRDIQGRSLLVVALQLGCFKFAQDFLSQAAAQNGEGANGLITLFQSQRPLLLQAELSRLGDGEERATSLQVITELLAAGAEDVQDEQGQTALQKAILFSDLEVVDLLLPDPRDHGASPITGHVLSHSELPLLALYNGIRASRAHRENLSTFMSRALQARANGLDILDVVVQARDTATLAVLVDWCARQQCGETILANALREALERAFMSNDETDHAVIEALIGVSIVVEAKFLVDCMPHASKTPPLAVAVMTGTAQAVEKMLQHPTVQQSLNIQDPLGFTALHHACSVVDGSNAHKIVDLILQSGADTLVTTKDDQIALHVAARYGNAHAVRQLLEARADGVSKKTKKSQTPLMLACASGNEATILLLLDANASVLDLDKEHKRPIDHLPRPNHISLKTLERLKPDEVSLTEEVRVGSKRTLEQAFPCATEATSSCDDPEGCVPAIRRAANKQSFKEICTIMKEHTSCLSAQLAGIRAFLDAMPAKDEREWVESQSLFHKIASSGVVQQAMDAEKDHRVNQDFVLLVFTFLVALQDAGGELHSQSRRDLLQSKDPGGHPTLPLPLRSMEDHRDHDQIQELGWKLLTCLVVDTDVSEHVRSSAVSLAQGRQEQLDELNQLMSHSLPQGDAEPEAAQSNDAALALAREDSDSDDEFIRSRDRRRVWAFHDSDSEEEPGQHGSGSSERRGGDNSDGREAMEAGPSISRDSDDEEASEHEDSDSDDAASDPSEEDSDDSESDSEQEGEQDDGESDAGESEMLMDEGGGNEDAAAEPAFEATDAQINTAIGSLHSMIVELIQCPIMKDMIRDPTCAPDGYIYEHSAINRCMRNGMVVSPVTRENFPQQKLVRLHGLRAFIEALRNRITGDANAAAAAAAAAGPALPMDVEQQGAQAAEIDAQSLVQQAADPRPAWDLQQQQAVQANEIDPQAPVQGEGTEMDVEGRGEEARLEEPARAGQASLSLAVSAGAPDDSTSGR